MENKELINQIVEMMELQTQGLMKYIDQRLTKVEIKIENDVTRKIEALFDGYKLTHEKQWELERRMEALERELEDIKTRIA